MATLQQAKDEINAIVLFKPIWVLCLPACVRRAKEYSAGTSAAL